MNIAFLSSLDPTDIHSWSGTLFFMWKHLSQFHRINWIGNEILNDIKLDSSEIWSDKFCIKKKKTAEHIVYLNNHKQIYPFEQQFSISCMESVFPQMYQRGIQR